MTRAWDNTPRAGANGLVLTGSSPENFERLVRQAGSIASARLSESAFIFLRSWNDSRSPES
ncbi:MAG: glycoside hydrolase family 99-like domain-containing protein [Longimicrobiales bacterium]